MASSYQPFLISEFKTGQFNYLEPWIRPNEAFDPLSNAYIYRGSLNKRNGYTLFGLLTYRDNGINIGVGNGGKTYSGTLAKFPIRTGSLFITTVTPVTAALIESFTDDGNGNLVGSAGGTGTIAYTTGVWSLTFNSNLTVGIIIRASYTYTPTQLTTPANLPIMAIKQFQDDSNNTRVLVACDTRRASVFNNSTDLFDPLSVLTPIVQSYTFVNGTGAPVVFTKTIDTGFLNLAPTSLSMSDGSVTVTDDGLGVFAVSAPFTPASTVSYASGVITLNYTVAAMTTANVTITVNGSLSGDYFSGTNANFFNSTNWRPNSTSTAYLYLTNDVDRVTLFDGTNLSRPPFGITLADVNAYVNDILHTLDVKVYKNRLLFVRPQVRGNSLVDGQSIRWSAQFVPFNFAADVSGNGGESSAPTDRWIYNALFLRDTLLVGFKGNQTWSFRFQGNAFDPFRWDKLNDSKSIDAPYGGVEYDERVTMMGSTGLIACDGVNVQRYDTPIIDTFLDINQAAFGQCFAQRFDTLNQTWMLYPSASNFASTSDSVLVYNFIENTWATYQMDMSCLGIYFVLADAKWQDFAVGKPLGTEYPSWADADVPWNYFVFQDLTPILLGGTQDGAVVTLNSGNQDGVNVPFETPSNVDASIKSARWNPFMGTGQRTNFGYVDIYYEINPECQILLSFYSNNSSNAAAHRVLTLDGPVNDDFAWKRIFINLNGEFIRMNMESELATNFKITGIILWAKPAGRMTPGATV